jgi:type IV pilus assembly protein PilO
MAVNLGLEGKPWYYGLAIGLFLAIACVAGTYYFFITDFDRKIKSTESQLAELDNQIAQGRSAERKLPQFREEVKRLELELEKLRRILPSTRNTEEIIKKIKALVDQGDFVLHRLNFPKLSPPQGSDPYAEWPITVDVEGGFHNMAFLFNRLSNFSRIINVEQFSISAMPSQTDRTISATFVARTFVYMEPGQTEGGATAAAPNPAKAAPKGPK